MTRATTTTAPLDDVLIRASAGSGKTYRLTTRYLALLARGVPPPSILGTTFTRAAAGEIRDRIVDRLAEAARDATARRELGAAIGAPLERAEDVLALAAALARNLHRLQIRTLDAFFASVVSSFALDLGIPPGSRIVEDETVIDLRQEAVARVFGAPDRERLVEVLRHLVQDGAPRSVLSKVDRLVKDLHELFREAPPEAWEAIDAPPGRRRADVEAALERLRRRGPALGTQQRRAVEKCVDLAEREDWESLADETIVRAVREGTLVYYRSALDDDIVPPLAVLAEHARAEVLHAIRRETLAARRLLHDYHATYRRLLAETGAITFADLAWAMDEARRCERLGDVWYRLDAVVDHLLLDEFQDTSILQWRALEPIALELVSDASRLRTFFCVGDVKQSIYGWREASPEVLDAIPDLLRGPDGASAIRVDDLPLNRRSSPVIVDAVNDVFLEIAANPALERDREAAVRWSASFREHDAHRKDLEGFVEMRTVARGSSTGEQRAIRYRAAAEQVRDLHEANPRLRIAVLARWNKTVAHVLHELSPARLGLPAAGRGGGPLTDAAPVNAILDALRLADHPGDTISAFNVARGPLGPVVELRDEGEAAERDRVARAIRRRLAHEGYLATLAPWARAVAPASDRRQATRLVRLLELAGRFDEQRTGRCDDFVRLVERRAVAQTDPAPIEVMTIHQAKGLEWDAVVLPDLEFDWSDSPTVLVERDGDIGPITAIASGRRRSIAELHQRLRAMADRHRERNAREALSLLYVAMTRARQGLYLLMDPSGFKKGVLTDTIPATAAAVARTAVHGPAPADEGAVVYRRGDPTWARRAEGSTLPAVEAPPPLAVSLRRGGPRRRGVLDRAPSAREESVDLATRLRVPDVESRDRGHAVHAMFEAVGWLDDARPDEDELRRAAAEAAGRRDEAWVEARVSEMIALLARPEVASLLARGDRPAERLELRREIPFAVERRGRIVRGTIDRMEVERDAAGHPVGARIIDFKTDAIGRSQIAERTRAHRPQLELYRDAVAELYGLEPESVEGVLLFTVLGRGSKVAKSAESQSP